jgi:hypothetical protein
MDEGTAAHLIARTESPIRQYGSVFNSSLGSAFLRHRPGLRRMGLVYWLLTMVMPCCVVSGSSTPYLKLRPPPLRFTPIPVLNRQFLQALGPLPTEKQITNAILHEITSTNLASGVESQVEMPSEPLSFDNAPADSAENANPFNGLLVPSERPQMPIESISPQTLLRFLCAPGQNGTNQPSHVIMQMYFNPPLPPVPVSSSATYTNGKP